MSSDPVGAAIAIAGVPDEPSSLHSSALRPSIDLPVGKPKASSDSIRLPEEVEDEDDFVVFEDRNTLPAPSLVSAELDNLEGVCTHQSNANKSTLSLIARASMESLSFGYRDHLLPLSLSGDGDETLAGDYENRESSVSAASRGYGGTSRRVRHHTRGYSRDRLAERRVTLLDGIALTVGVQIGSGIFSSPGVVTLNTGSIGASIVIWLLSGLLAWTGASSFAELGASIPLNGGSQAYLNYSFGPLSAFLYTWSALTALKPGAGAIIATIFGEYVARIIFHATGKATDRPHETGLDGIPNWSIKLLAVGIVAFIAGAHAFSNKLGTRTQIATTVVKVMVLIVVPILAIVQAARGKSSTSSLKAFSSIGNLFEGSSTSPSSYALALYSGLWAFDGWDQSCFVAGEMKRVEKDLPKVIHVSMGMVILMFLSAVVAYFQVLPVELVKRTNTVALDFGSAIFGTVGGIVFAFLVAFSCFGALNGQIYTTARLIQAASREGYLPERLGDLNRRTGTPVAALILQVVLVSAFILLGSGFASLVNFYGVCSWTFYLASVLGLLVLRIKEPNLNRPYRTWLVTPILFAAVALFLLLMPIGSAPLEGLAALLFIAAGMPVYYLTQSKARWVSNLSFLSKLKGMFARGGAGVGVDDGRGHHIPLPTSDRVESAPEEEDDEEMEMLPKAEEDGKAQS
ncbi:related to large neutral amino acid transporter 1 [Melanopsichium pennsylvanicum]|uniref:Related to large neutral amino acid transporter 1 n=2 Tax=Melanopsichium pennsylvanicum TaxID=63383 RepID=A0AAJ4XL58_9BASI|nr:related to large neutral amino acid transporter 1 [Melanopsichium pennsylvanicum 4]SNX83108.1 related to large neutral amino acid transporter 1 [Melanopsichium pennsylvanicum]